MYCLDSDFLIDVMRGQRAAVALLDEFGSSRPFVSAVTAYEATDTRNLAVREAAFAMLETVDIVPVDGSIAFVASRHSAALRARGRPLPTADLLIAATCLLRRLTLVTRNRRHFARIPGLRVLSW